MARNDRPFRPTSPAAVDDDARVRHFDELDEAVQQALVGDGDDDRLVSDGGSLAGLDPGDVVVFTDYYRVVGR